MTQADFALSTATVGVDMRLAAVATDPVVYCLSLADAAHRNAGGTIQIADSGYLLISTKIAAALVAVSRTGCKCAIGTLTPTDGDTTSRVRRA